MQPLSPLPDRCLGKSKARTLDLDELAVRAMTEWTISHAPIPTNSAPTAKNSHERRTATPTVATARPTMSTGC